jgi:hypothetical protein
MAADKRIIAYFRTHRAISAKTAVPYRPERGFDLRRLERLIRRGLVREAAPGQFYLDEAAVTAWRERQQAASRIILLVALVSAIVGAVVIWLLR